MKSIAELRKEAILKIAKRKEAEPTEATLADAQKLMNSFYRFVGFYNNNFLLSQERGINKEYLAKREEQEAKRLEKLEKWFSSYNLAISFPGLYPVLMDLKTKNDIHSLTWFY